MALLRLHGMEKQKKERGHVLNLEQPKTTQLQKQRPSKGQDTGESYYRKDIHHPRIMTN